MLIGLTYDLRSEYLAMGFGEEETAEFDRDDTIASIERAVRALGHRTERIGHAVSLMAALSGGRRWDLVFNIAEGLRGPGRESLVPAMLDHAGIPYTFSDPLVMAVGLDKPTTKVIVRAAGVPTPDFAVLRSGADAAAVALPMPVFLKPAAEGTGKGVSSRSIVRERSELAPRAEELIAKFRQPVLAETLLPGREFTTGILGTGARAEAVGSLEVVLLPAADAGAYGYHNKEKCEDLVEYRLVRAAADPVVAEAEAIALAAWRALGCRDAGRVDLRCDAAGRPSFMEVNPLAGLHPEHSDLPILCTKVGIAYGDLIRRIVESAAERVAVPK